MYKTEHFTYRLWDRSIDESVIRKIIAMLKPSRVKTIVIVSNNKLRELTEKKSQSNLIIIQDGHALITLFYVKNIYSYLKSINYNQNYIIL